MSFKCVMFDMDGLLLNTEDVYTKVTNQILSEYGLPPFTWELKKRMMGQREDDACRLFVEETGIALSAIEYRDLRTRMHEEHFPSCRPLPGVMEVVSRLHQLKIPICVATSSTRSAYLLKSRENEELFSLFQGNIICGDEVVRGKPAPDLFLEAAKRLGFSGKECLVFEDAASGVQAGLAAGMQVVWVPDPNNSPCPKLRVSCLEVLDSMLSFDLTKYF